MLPCAPKTAKMKTACRYLAVNGAGQSRLCAKARVAFAGADVNDAPILAQGKGWFEILFVARQGFTALWSRVSRPQRNLLLLVATLAGNLFWRFLCRQ